MPIYNQPMALMNTGVFIIFHWGAHIFFTLAANIIWYRAVMCLVSVSNCVVYIAVETVEL